MHEVQAPHPLAGPRPWIFLAGSIDNGAAEPWQQAFVARMRAFSGTLLNPRRADWDASWKQSIEDLRFREQVEWELAALETCDLIVMYFAPASKAPITLLELGLFAPHHTHRRGGSLVVACPEGYWRRGNVEVVCNRYEIPLVDSFEALVLEAERYVSG